MSCPMWQLQQWGSRDHSQPSPTKPACPDGLAYVRVVLGLPEMIENDVVHQLVWPAAPQQAQGVEHVDHAPAGHHGVDLPSGNGVLHASPAGSGAHDACPRVWAGGSTRRA
jgi:hypothetical protein